MEILDLDRLRDITGNDPGMLREIVQLLLQESASGMEALRKAVAGADLNKVSYSAHKLAGSSANCGLEALAAALRRVELEAINTDRATLQALMNEVENQFAAAKERLVSLAAGKSQ